MKQITITLNEKQAYIIGNVLANELYDILDRTTPLTEARLQAILDDDFKTIESVLEQINVVD